MINQILDYTKKYYPRTFESGTFKIVADGIEGTFSETYFVGQYVNVQDSVMNDGTYKISAVTSSKLTVEETLIAEESTMCVWGLQLPKGLISLISDIDSYVSSQGTKAELASETQGNRSVSYKNGSSWQSAFKSQLGQYRNVYDDRITFCRKYNVLSKR